MELNLQSGGKTAIATADVARGWRQLRNTFGFCEEGRLELAGGTMLRVQASIFAWPNIFGSRLLRYPQNVYGLVKERWGRLELREAELRLAIELPTIQAERLARSGLPGVYQEPVMLDRLERIGFWFSLLIVLGDRIQREYPDIREWDTQFFMGGRPGANRRH